MDCQWSRDTWCPTHDYSHMYQDNVGQVTILWTCFCKSESVFVLHAHSNSASPLQSEYTVCVCASFYEQFTDGWKLVASDSKILRIGLIQALSEGGIYTVSKLYRFTILYVM